MSEIQQELPDLPPHDRWADQVKVLRQEVALLRQAGCYLVVVTGSRRWGGDRDNPLPDALKRQRWAQVEQALRAVQHEAKLPGQRMLLVHGQARGLDRMAGYVAQQRLGWNVLDLKAPWDQYRNGAGPIRNQAMVDLKPDVVLAFYLPAFYLPDSVGTRDCADRAKRAGIRVIEREGTDG